MKTKTVSETYIPNLQPIHRGKVRDVYQINDDQLLLVATDRLSAFDCVMPNQVPRKGEVLTQISAFWFQKLQDIVENHLITVDHEKMPDAFRLIPELKGRSTLARKTEVFPIECVVRGYLEGSGWKDYQKTGKICGHQLPSGLKHCEKLPESLFTPSTKASTGHDENIDKKEFIGIVGKAVAKQLENLSLQIYGLAAEYALARGIIIADTKFEFGHDADGNILLIDEVLTPDSSRFWAADPYKPGKPQPSFDKQFVREYLETLDWDKQPPAPKLPSKIIRATTNKYLEAFRLLTGDELD